MTARRRAGAVGRADLLERLQLQAFDWLELPSRSRDEDASGGPGYQRGSDPPGKPLPPPDLPKPPRLPDPDKPTRQRQPLRMPWIWTARATTPPADETDADADAQDDAAAAAAADGAAAQPAPTTRWTADDADRAAREQESRAVRQAWQQLQQPLRALLNPWAETPWRRPVDWRRVTERVAQGSSLWPLPRQAFNRWPANLDVVFDVDAWSMRPFIGDALGLRDRLARTMGGRALRALAFGEAPAAWPPEARRRPDSAVTGPRTWRATQANRTLLFVSDFGGPAVSAFTPGQQVPIRGNQASGEQATSPVTPVLTQAQQQRLLWLQAQGRTGTTVLALMPDPAAAPRGLAAYAVRMAWRRPGVPVVACADGSVGRDAPEVSTVLALVHLFGSVTSALLRALVHEVASPALDEAALLWRVWNHPHIKPVGYSGLELRDAVASTYAALLVALPRAMVEAAWRRHTQLEPGDIDRHFAALRAARLVAAQNLHGPSPLADAARAARVALDHELPRTLGLLQGADRARFAAGIACAVHNVGAHVRQAQRRRLRKLLSLAFEPELRSGKKPPSPPEIGPLAPASRHDDAAVQRSWMLVQAGAELLLLQPTRLPRHRLSVMPEGDDEHVALHDSLHGVVLLESVGPAPVHAGVAVAAGGQTRWHDITENTTRVPLEDLGGKDMSEPIAILLGDHAVQLTPTPRPTWATSFHLSPTGTLHRRLLTPWGEEVEAPHEGGPNVTLRPPSVKGPGFQFGLDRFGLHMDMSFDAAQVTQRFRWIGPGRFFMGSPEEEAGRWDGEGPRHEVELTQGFWLADTPCTQALWKAVTGRKTSTHFADADDWQHPVTEVSWDDVQAFLHKLEPLLPQGSRPSLPTEAQWEYAARAGTTTAYSWGDEPDSAKANWNGERSGTTPVGSYEPNPWGLYDVHGNVWEWCDDSPRRYGEAPAIDPVGDAASRYRALRGGSWFYAPRHARAASRYGRERDARYRIIGFRLALRSASQVGGAEAQGGGAASSGTRSGPLVRRGAPENFLQKAARVLRGGKPKK